MSILILVLVFVALSLLVLYVLTDESYRKKMKPRYDIQQSDLPISQDNDAREKTALVREKGAPIVILGRRGQRHD